MSKEQKTENTATKQTDIRGSAGQDVDFCPRVGGSGLLNGFVAVSLPFGLVFGADHVINNTSSPAAEISTAPADTVEMLRKLNGGGQKVAEKKVRQSLINDTSDQNENWNDIDLIVSSSSDAKLDRGTQKKLNSEAKSSFDFANSVLKGCFPADMEGFSVISVSEIQLGEGNDKQLLINLMGKDKSGVFTFNLLKLGGRYYPLFNLVEYPPILKETPVRMPVILLPNEETNKSYKDMWKNITFQVTPGLSRIVHLDPSGVNQPPRYSMTPWLMDFSGDGLPDLIFNGDVFDEVIGGFESDMLPTSSGDFDPANYNYSNQPSVDDPFYVQRSDTITLAVGKEGKTEISATFDQKTGKWVWKNK